MTNVTVGTEKSTSSSTSYTRPGTAYLYTGEYSAPLTITAETGSTGLSLSNFTATCTFSSSTTNNAGSGYKTVTTTVRFSGTATGNGSITVQAAPTLTVRGDDGSTKTETLANTKCSLQIVATGGDEGGDSGGGETTEYTHTATLYYNGNGGTLTSAPNPVTKSYTSTDSTPTGSASFSTYWSSYAPSRSGYDFEGWSKSSSATSATYTNNGTITVPYGSSVTLYAVWSKETTYYYARLYYNANGGSGAPSSQSASSTSSGVSKSFTISSTKPTRSGYIFLGWSTSSSATSASYQPGGSITVSTNSSKTLYAVWQEEVTYYYAYLTYSANGGSGAPSQQSGSSTTSGASLSFTISTTVPTRSGYRFLGWARSSSSATAGYASGGSISVPAGSTYTLYAIWTEILTLSYDANGTIGGGDVVYTQSGSTSTTTSPVYATSVDTEEPTSTGGFVFTGWATSSLGSAAYQPGDAITLTENTTLYAVWHQSIHSGMLGKTNSDYWAWKR